MHLLAAAATVSLYVVVTTMGAPLRAQGVWTVGFDHLPDNHGQNPPYPVHPSSHSISNPQNWITQNLPQNMQVTPGQGMNTVHVCLIPSGVHRGEVLVWDGNLFNHPVRAFQPWSIVNPYWPALNPNYWPGQTTPQYRFHNATLAMPLVGGVPEGELFCAGQCWMADGRLLVAGGTKSYPPTHPHFEGTRFLYQWDHVPDLSTGDPFGKWYPMAPLETPRWYPTVIYGGTADHRAIVIGGTHWTSTPWYPTLLGDNWEVNSYEVTRTAFNSPSPMLAVPNFDVKPLGATSPSWNMALSSDRQFWGPIHPNGLPAFGDYPRIHALGILDPITGGTSPRLFVSGFQALGMRWAHDRSTDPVFSSVGGQGYEIGQAPASGDDRVLYPTSLLLPGLPGGISTQVARIGGLREHVTNASSNLVETVVVNASPSPWLIPSVPPVPGTIPAMHRRRLHGNVVMLPTGDLFAIGGIDLIGTTLTYNVVPELLVGGTTWIDMAPHAGARNYHSAAVLLPDGRVFVCGGEQRKISIPGVLTPGPDYLIWEPPYFNLSEGSVPATGITVRNDATSVIVQQFLVAPNGMAYGQTYRADWTNTLEPGISINSVVLMRPAALTHHDDGGQRMVRLNAWDDGTENTVVFQTPATVLHAPPGWWMLFLVNSAGRPSQAYWVNLG